MAQGLFGGNTHKLPGAIKHAAANLIDRPAAPRMCPLPLFLVRQGAEPPELRPLVELTPIAAH